MKKDSLFLTVFCILMLLICTPALADSSPVTSEPLQTEQIQSIAPVTSPESKEPQIVINQPASSEILMAQSSDEEDDYMDYEEGEEDLLNVLTIQQRGISSRSSLSTAERLQLEQRVNLNLALGGSWEN